MIKTRKKALLSLFFITNFVTSFCTDTTEAQLFDVNLPQQTEKISRTNRMRKPKNKKQKTKKTSTYLDFDYEQLVVAKDKQKAHGNTSATIKYLEQLLKLCTDVTLLSEHLLELADMFFIDGQFKTASRIYTQYCSLYPGSARLEYALYRSVESSFACILPFDRDQTKTEETLALVDLFLQQEQFSTHKEDVLRIQTKCHEQLAASECNICNFYLTGGRLTAAEKRLKKIRSYWLPKLPTLEPEIIALETQLAEQKEMLEAQAHKNTELAHNSKKHMSQRF